jgi:hypothetical protein
MRGGGGAIVRNSFAQIWRVQVLWIHVHDLCTCARKGWVWCNFVKFGEFSKYRLRRFIHIKYAFVHKTTYLIKLYVCKYICFNICQTHLARVGQNSKADIRFAQNCHHCLCKTSFSKKLNFVAFKSELTKFFL